MVDLRGGAGQRGPVVRGFLAALVLLTAVVPVGLATQASAASSLAATATPGKASVSLSTSTAGADGVTAKISTTMPVRAALGGVRVVLPAGAGVPAQTVAASLSGSARSGVGRVERTGTLAVRWSRPATLAAGAPVTLTLTGLANPNTIGSFTGRLDWLDGSGRTVKSAPLSFGYAGGPACGAFRAKGWVTSENSRPGVSWKVSGDSDIEGYADRVSAQCGDTVRLMVSTSAPTYTIQVLRMGWYGGAGARLIFTSGTLPGGKQADPDVKTDTGTVTANWNPSATFRIGGSWPPGDYLFKLISSTGSARFVPLTIRDDGSSSALVVQNSVMTWQAYNLWGGWSLYHGPGSDLTLRGVVVNWNRPYAGDGVNTFGDGQFVQLEQPFVAWAEQQGYDLTYSTDVDLDARPALLLRHKALVMLTHDEYWTQAMRAGALNARNRGVNIASFGGNSMYWKARLSGNDRRTLIVYRTQDRDPNWSVPSLVTNRWRDAPAANPESAFLGGMYDCINTVKSAPVTSPKSWVFAGLGVKDGTELSKIAWWEFDRYHSNSSPKNVELLAHARFPCTGHANAASGYDMTYYTASSKAGVFSAGTMGWICNLNASCDPHPGDTRMRTIVSRITANVLSAFSAGPAGIKHPATPNAAAVCKRLGCLR